MKRFLLAAQELGEEMGKLEMRLKEGAVQVEGEEVEESRRRIQELYLQVGSRVNIRILYFMFSYFIILTLPLSRFATSEEA